MTDAARTPDPTHWSLDKRVPLSLIFAIMLQAGAMIWWGSKLDSQIEAHDRRLTVVEETVSRRGAEQDAKNAYMAEILARIDERLIAIQKQLERGQTTR